MKEELFDTEAKKTQAIGDFQGLLNNPGWLLLEKMLMADIENLMLQLENGVGANETKADIDRMRDGIRTMRSLLNMPKSKIKEFQKVEDEEIILDPFHDVDSLKKLRNQKPIEPVLPDLLTKV